jgi:mono/diheme cytochrome c family protein
MGLRNINCYKRFITMKTLLTKRAFLALSLMGGAAFLMSSTEVKLQQKGEWVAPASADATKNPLAGQADAVAAGKKTYTTYCVVCHGDKGRGDGIAAGGLNPKPADHSGAKFQKQSDGAIFWKLTTGRPPMASYAKTLTETQRWQVITYMRTLAKK